MTNPTSTEHEYEVRYAKSDEVDSFSDEGDAQEWAVGMARRRVALRIVRRTVEVTRVVGDWEEIPVTIPADDYRVGDRLVSNLSGYVYKIVDVDRAERRVKFAAAWDLEDAGWESFEDVASAFRHVSAGGVE